MLKGLSRDWESREKLPAAAAAVAVAVAAMPPSSQLRVIDACGMQHWPLQHTERAVGAAYCGPFGKGMKKKPVSFEHERGKDTIMECRGCV